MVLMESAGRGAVRGDRARAPAAAPARGRWWSRRGAERRRRLRDRPTTWRTGGRRCWCSWSRPRDADHRAMRWSSWRWPRTHRGSRSSEAAEDGTGPLGGPAGGADILVDAIFGTGLRADVDGRARRRPSRAMNGPAARCGWRWTSRPGSMPTPAQVQRGGGARPTSPPPWARLKVGPGARRGRTRRQARGGRHRRSQSRTMAEGARRRDRLCYWLDADGVAALAAAAAARSGHKGTARPRAGGGGLGGQDRRGRAGRAGALRAGAGLVTIASTRDGQRRSTPRCSRR